jgi:hypothetical protein
MNVVASFLSSPPNINHNTECVDFFAKQFILKDCWPRRKIFVRVLIKILCSKLVRFTVSNIFHSFLYAILLMSNFSVSN